MKKKTSENRTAPNPKGSATERLGRLTGDPLLEARGRRERNDIRQREALGDVRQPADGRRAG